MIAEFKLRFNPAEIRTRLIAQAVENQAIPANVNPDTLQMKISPVTGVTFLPPEEASTDGDQSGDSNTPDNGTDGETPSA